jgi:hypothetical protein
MRIPLTPLIVQQDPELQAEIIRRERAHNQAVIGDPGYKLEIGDSVRVENPKAQNIKHRTRWIPGSWNIVDYQNGGYVVYDRQSNQTLIVPRSAISISK